MTAMRSHVIVALALLVSFHVVQSMPMGKGRNLEDFLRKNIPPSVKDKAEAVDSLLRLIADLDLPSLCHAIKREQPMPDLPFYEDIITQSAVDQGYPIKQNAPAASGIPDFLPITERDYSNMMGRMDNSLPIVDPTQLQVLDYSIDKLPNADLVNELDAVKPNSTTAEDPLGLARPEILGFQLVPGEQVDMDYEVTPPSEDNRINPHDATWINGYDIKSPETTEASETSLHEVDMHTSQAGIEVSTTDFTALLNPEKSTTAFATDEDVEEGSADATTLFQEETTTGTYYINDNFMTSTQSQELESEDNIPGAADGNDKLIEEDVSKIHNFTKEQINLMSKDGERTGENADKVNSTHKNFGLNALNFATKILNDLSMFRLRSNSKSGQGKISSAVASNKDAESTTGHSLQSKDINRITYDENVGKRLQPQNPKKSDNLNSNDVVTTVKYDVIKTKTVTGSYDIPPSVEIKNTLEETSEKGRDMARKDSTTLPGTKSPTNAPTEIHTLTAVKDTNPPTTKPEIFVTDDYATASGDVAEDFTEGFISVDGSPLPRDKFTMLPRSIHYEVKKDQKKKGNQQSKNDKIYSYSVNALPESTDDTLKGLARVVNINNSTASAVNVSGDEIQSTNSSIEHTLSENTTLPTVTNVTGSHSDDPKTSTTTVANATLPRSPSTTTTPISSTVTATSTTVSSSTFTTTTAAPTTPKVPMTTRSTTPLDLKSAWLTLDPKDDEKNDKEKFYVIGEYNPYAHPDDKKNMIASKEKPERVPEATQITKSDPDFFTRQFGSSNSHEYNTRHDNSRPYSVHSGFVRQTQEPVPVDVKDTQKPYIKEHRHTAATHGEYGDTNYYRPASFWTHYLNPEASYWGTDESQRYIRGWKKTPQLQASNENKVQTTKTLDFPLLRTIAGVNQKTIWSQTPQKRAQTSGYVCPGLFGYHPDATTCKAFYICSWGIPYRFKCPPKTMWSQEKNVCDWERNVHCEHK